MAAVYGLLPGPSIAATANLSMSNFSHGVNLSHWFAQSLSGYDAGHLASFVTDTSLNNLKHAGFDHVRLSVSPNALFTSDRKAQFNAETLSLLDNSLKRIQAAGLNVVLDLHPVGGEKASVLNDAQEDRLSTYWELITRAFKELSTDNLAFELLNEPAPANGNSWWRLQTNVLSSIRSIDRNRLVIVNGGGWSGIDDLLTHTPYEDPRVAYTIHYYAPILFTHQGADWSWDVAERVSALSWPVSDSDAVRISNTSTHDQIAEHFVREQISAGDFTRQWMDQQFAKLAEWQHHYNVSSIYVGEFGVYAKTAPQSARLRWITAVREECEQRNWGWAVWDNSSSFGFLSERDGKLIIDPDMLLALGTNR